MEIIYYQNMSVKKKNYEKELNYLIRGHSYYFRGPIGEANCILVDYIYDKNNPFKKDTLYF